MARAAAATLFVCPPRGKGGVDCSEPGCRDASVAECTFPLRGRKVGKTCGRKCCARHGGKAGKPVCGAHQRMIESRRQ